MKLSLTLFCNHEIRIGSQSVGGLSASFRGGDCAAQRRATRKSLAEAERARLSKLLLCCDTRPEDFEERLTCSLDTPRQSTLPFAPDCVSGSLEKFASPSVVVASPRRENGAGLTFEKKYARDILRERERLDILLESQYAFKNPPPDPHPDRPFKGRPWGLPQPDRRFTSNARHSLLEAAAALDQVYGKNQAVLTLTLPGSTWAAKDAISRWSGWIINRQLQTLRNRPDSKDFAWFFVWEKQKRGALHQHWCLAGSSVELAKEVAAAFKDCFYRCLEEISSREGIDLFERSYGGTWRDRPDVWKWDLQAIKKSCGAYFGKYASKNALAAQKAPKESDSARPKNAFAPSRWWGCARPLQKLYKSLRLRIVFDYASEKKKNEILGDIRSILHGFQSVSYSKAEFFLRFSADSVRPDFQYEGHRFYFPGGGDNSTYISLRKYLLGLANDCYFSPSECCSPPRVDCSGLALEEVRLWRERFAEDCLQADNGLVYPFGVTYKDYTNLLRGNCGIL